MSGAELNQIHISRLAGLSLLASIAIGILATVFLTSDININLSADISATSQIMMQEATRLRGKAYVSLLLFAFEVLTVTGLYIILKRSSAIVASWCLLVALSAAVLVLLGSVGAMNVAMMADNSAFQALANQDQRLLLASVQVTSEYTSFHLSLVLNCVAKAGFFYLFMKSRKIPLLIAAWGIFASLFVAFTIVARDFVPALGHTAVTGAFMLSNLVALVSLGLYLSIWGIRTVADSHEG